MNNDDVFTEAVKKCNNEITREVISGLIKEDRTGTIRKYLASFGMAQLGLRLQEIGMKMEPPKMLRVFTNSESDLKQKKVQQRTKALKDDVFRPETSAEMLDRIYSTQRNNPPQKIKLPSTKIKFASTDRYANYDSSWIRSS